MHPLQTALKQGIAALTAAQTELATFRTQRDGQDARIAEIEIESTKAIDALKLAHPNQVAEAEATSERCTRDLRTAHLRLEGCAEKLAAAEKTVDLKQRAVDRATSDLAVEIAQTIERAALDHAGKLGRLVRRRLLLARIASRASTAASGHMSEPISGASGERTAFSRELDELLGQTRSEETIVVSDLLDWPMVDTAAQAAE